MSKYLARGGKPAPGLGHEGMPTYYTDAGHAVMGLLVALARRGGGYRYLGRRYTALADNQPENGFVKLTRLGMPDWRPAVYESRQVDPAAGHMQRIGSHQEQRYRSVVHALRHPVEAERWWERELQAYDVFKEMLNPWQWMRLCINGRFPVYGARTGNFYAVEPGNGFHLLAEKSHWRIASYCFHPEAYRPYWEVALQTKLMLEDPEQEEDVLRAAKCYPRLEAGHRLPHEAEAAAIEREMILEPA